ncbi:MAG: cyclase family protein [Actinobacteria bacterium]|uniref:Unannotated protein n=1 Tax=freshwater metagenome TaxID=449393 RepID=A0A6J7BTS3_9ZZZZ|nr:cyclase family protein [Actinomycetota bacterium]MSW36933.1 cyclase family protein [Actinomycetota bacterium]MSX38141.1 cyclase family protein [Actinomycetota bacterium]
MVGNWGRWGASDEAGSLNFIDPSVVVAASTLVRDGRVVSLSQDLGPQTPTAPHRSSPSRFMDRDAGDYALGARSPGGFRFAEDSVLFPSHSGTHIDALAHAWSGDSLYNGHDAGFTRSTRGAQRCGAEKLKPIVTRGVFLDLASICGGEPKIGRAFSADDLAKACDAVNVVIGAGDAVCIRTGWWPHAGRDPELFFSGEPGIDSSAAQWLADREVAVVGADNYAVECLPAPSGDTFPVHLILLWKYGVPLIEGLDLEELATAGRSEFLFVAAPLRLVGSTGSPLHPIAVL